MFPLTVIFDHAAQGVLDREIDLQGRKILGVSVAHNHQYDETTIMESDGKGNDMDPTSGATLPIIMKFGLYQSHTNYQTSIMFPKPWIPRKKVKVAQYGHNVNYRCVTFWIDGP